MIMHPLLFRSVIAVDGQKQEITHQDDNEVYILPAAKTEQPRHQASPSRLLYNQLSKLQQIPCQEHPLHQGNKRRQTNLANYD